MFVAVFACVSLAATKHAVELTTGNFDELVNGKELLYYDVTGKIQLSVEIYF